VGGGRVISRNLKWGGGYRQIPGGVNLLEAKIYIKKILKNIEKQKLLGGRGVVSQLGEREGSLPPHYGGCTNISGGWGWLHCSLSSIFACEMCRPVLFIDLG